MADHARHPETRDVWPRALLLFAGGLIVFLLISSAVLYALFHEPSRWPQPGAAWSANKATPALSTSPHQDLASIRSEEDAELNRLVWVDRKAGIVRIPIDDAMKLVARDGLPHWTQKTEAGDCAFLTDNVPRSAAARQCRDAKPQGDDR